MEVRKLKGRLGTIYSVVEDEQRNHVPKSWYIRLKYYPYVIAMAVVELLIIAFLII